MAQYSLTPAAQLDLEEIFDYSAENWGLEQAVRYTQMLANACARLAEAPWQSQDCAHIRAGYRRLNTGRHMLYFLIRIGRALPPYS